MDPPTDTVRVGESPIDPPTPSDLRYGGVHGGGGGVRGGGGHPPVSGLWDGGSPPPDGGPPGPHPGTPTTRVSTTGSDRLEIDWTRTLATGGITTAVMVAIYIADSRDALLSGEDPGGCAVMVGLAAGIGAGLVVGNLLLA